MAKARPINAAHQVIAIFTPSPLKQGSRVTWTKSNSAPICLRNCQNTQVSPILWLDERCMRHITHTDILTLIRLYKWYVYYSPREAS